MSPGEFAATWDILRPSVTAVLPEGQNAPALPGPVTGVFAGLDLQAFTISEGSLLATSLHDGRINGYTLFFDSENTDAFSALIVLRLAIGEAVLTGPVLDAIYMGGPSPVADVPMAFDGDNHQIEILRTGADPVNDPLWVLTATPVGSSVDHGTLRLATAEAAIASF